MSLNKIFPKDLFDNLLNDMSQQIDLFKNQFRIMMTKWSVEVSTDGVNVSNEDIEKYMDKLENIDYKEDTAVIKQKLETNFREWLVETGLDYNISYERVTEFIENIRNLDINKVLLTLKRVFYDKFEEILRDWLVNQNFVWDINQKCENDDKFWQNPFSGKTWNGGMMGILNNLSHIKQYPFWFLFFGTILGLLILPTIQKIRKHSEITGDNWDSNGRDSDGNQTSQNMLKDSFLAKFALTPEDVGLTLINIMLFAVVSFGLFYFVLSKDVSRILETNLELYLGIIKKEEELKNRLLRVLKEVKLSNKKSFDDYKNWSSKCNKGFDRRPFYYIAVVLAILLIFVFIVKRLGYKTSFDGTFWMSAFMIMFVFTTELYMLMFVFTKVTIAGEIELPYKLLSKISNNLLGKKS